MTPRPPLKAALERDKLSAEIRKLEAEAEKAEAEAKAANRDLADTEASANRARIYPFMGGVNEASVRSCLATLGTWSRRDPGQGITVEFNSPGGSVIDGLALFDYIDELKAGGTRVTTVGRGWVASMGGVLLQVGTERVIGVNAHMLIHEVSSGNFGKLSEMEDELKFSKRLQDRILTILAERSTLSVDQIKRRWARKDWWLGAEEVVELGFADRIG